MKGYFYPNQRSVFTSLSHRALLLPLIFQLFISNTFAGNSLHNNFKSDVKVDTTIFPFGENAGWYGTQYTDQQIYDLMYAGGARSARTILSIQQWQQFGIAPFAARFNYPYQSKGMRNNVFTLRIDPYGGNYTGQSTQLTAGGNQSYLPSSLYLPIFNADGTVNRNNIWAAFCSDVVNAVNGSFQYYEIYNEPDFTYDWYDNQVDSSTGNLAGWATVQPTPDQLPNMYDSISNLVQMHKIASLVIKHFQPNAKIATGGIGSKYFYRWFCKLGGMQWTDILSLHMYPYYDWTSYTDQSPAGPGNQRHSDMLVHVTDSLYKGFVNIGGQNGIPSSFPHMITEVNTPRWTYDFNTSAGSQNKRWGNDHVQRNFSLKGISKFIQNGFSPVIFFQTGEAADSGNVSSGVEFDAEGMYKNLTTATPTTAVLTPSGQAMKVMQQLMGNYVLDPVQPAFGSGIDGVRFDSAGNKLYVIWAKTTLDTLETASGSYTLPAGQNFKQYIWNGSLLGTVSGTIALNGDPYILVQSSGPITTSVVANAGSNQTITLPVNSVNLSGAASTVTGSTISSYSWTQTSGPGTASFSADTSVKTTANNLVQGTYVFSLLVKDKAGDSSRASVTITVNAIVNLPPVVSAGTTQTITLPTSTVNLKGTATDSTGTIASYAWSQSSGPAGATITTPTGLSSTVTGLTAGTYVFVLKVTDSYGLSATASVTIIVNPAVVSNPVANAGADQVITLPVNTVTLSGSASTDPNGTIAGYSWSQVSGPANSVIASASAVSTAINGLAKGVYVFKLTVTDTKGASSTDTVQVTVKAAPNQPPVANAGASRTITLPSSSVSLDGTKSSDPDGTIASYSWAQVSGPSTAVITGAATATPTLSALVAGQYVFQLTVTDNSGASSSAQVKVIVNPAANIAPTANAGSDQSITLPLSAVTLDGTGSIDPDGTISSYSWTQVSGPAQGTIVSASSATTVVSSLVKGTYVFRLTVTDNLGATGTDTVSVVVNAAPNQPPVANAGTSKTITLPTSSVNLDGTKSYDPDGTIASYSWTQVSGPSNATLGGATTATPSVSSLSAGQYVFMLTVTDNSGATSTAQVKVTVNAAANINPIANAGAGQTITLPVDSVTLDGSASLPGSGTLTAFSWTKISGPASYSISQATGVTTLVNGLVQGSYTFQLTVTNSTGNKASDTVTILVNAAANKAPVANAGSGKTITLPVNTVTLDGTKSYDPDGTIVSYSWIQLSGPAASTLTGGSSASPTASALLAGQYVFQLTVTDNSGASSRATVKITVRGLSNIAPVANAGANQSITLPVNSVTLDGSASADPDGTIVSYSWSKVSGPAQGTLVSPTAATTAANSLVQGTYVFALTVTDNSGAKGTDTVTVTVMAAANQPPVANAGNSITISLPTNSATLNGSKSSDPDGTIASYSWIQLSGPSTATLTSGNTSAPVVSSLIAGQYVFQLKVTDNKGASSTASVKVIVNAAAVANLPPVANAGANQNITLPASSVVLDGSKSYDPDGTITSYSWSKVSGNGAVVISNSSTATPTLSGLTVGIYTFLLTVTDNQGAFSSAEVTITVNAQPVSVVNQAPVAIAGRDTTIAIPSNSVVLDGSASYDPDGQIVSYQWKQISGPGSAILSALNADVSTVTTLLVGVYQFSLTVTDNSGASSSDTVKITVVDNLRSTESILLYPNPAQSTINLRLFSDSTGEMKINIVDANGRIVESWNIDKTQNFFQKSMNISRIAHGMYTLQVVMGVNKQMISKFLKQ